MPFSWDWKSLVGCRQAYRCHACAETQPRHGVSARAIPARTTAVYHSSAHLRLLLGLLWARAAWLLQAVRRRPPPPRRRLPPPPRPLAPRHLPPLQTSPRPSCSSSSSSASCRLHSRGAGTVIVWQLYITWRISKLQCVQCPARLASTGRYRGRRPPLRSSRAGCIGAGMSQMLSAQAKLT